MNKRETLMTQEYFDEEVKYETETIKDFQNDLLDLHDANPKDVASFLYSIFRKNCELFFLKYSQGEDIALLKNNLNDIVDAFEKYSSHPSAEKIKFDDGQEDYETCLWLISISILLNIDNNTFNKLLIFIGNEGEDELFEALVGRRIEGRKKANKLIYLKEYHILLDATKGAHNGINIQQFLLSWYGNMKQCYWYDNHKGKEGGGFFGYWCWEAAAVSVAFNIDDARFRDMKYYPKDMADFARELANG